MRRHGRDYGRLFGLLIDQAAFGNIFTVKEISEADPTHVLCLLQRAEELQEELIPADRQLKAVFCASTPYKIEIKVSGLRRRCEVVVDPQSVDETESLLV
ncbi:MAG: hypothetical protein N2C12_04015 [Planctomycetales bacterium]